MVDHHYITLMLCRIEEYACSAKPFHASGKVKKVVLIKMNERRDR